MKYLITGGAGFIGSNLADRILKEDPNNTVIVYDNFSTGQEPFVKHNLSSSRYSLIKGDVLDQENLKKSMESVDFVFHLQANADVRGGVLNNRVDLEQNTIATYNVLEAMRINNVKNIAFASSATVYGDPKKFPTPEDNQLIQTSTYGASKAAGEGLIEAFSEYYDVKSWIFRFVSFIGERYTHGVIFDFIKKLYADNTQLEILGDGKQRKSYLYIQDGIDAIFCAIKNSTNQKNIYNLGHTEIMNVTDLANIIFDEIGLKDVTLKYTGGDRGWKGDSPFVLLDTARITGLGWKPKVSIEDGIRRTVRYLKENEALLFHRK